MILTLCTICTHFLLPSEEILDCFHSEFLILPTPYQCQECRGGSNRVLCLMSSLDVNSMSNQREDVGQGKVGDQVDKEAEYVLMHSSWKDIAHRNILNIMLHNTSSEVINEYAQPLRPALAVLPTRCINILLLSTKS